MKTFKTMALTLALVISASFAWGAAMTVTYVGTKTETWFNKQVVNRVQLKCLQPAAAAGDAFLLSSVSSPESILTDYYRGAVLFQIETDPGTQPDGAYTLTILSDKASPILALTGLSVTASALHNGAADLGFTPIVYDLSVDFGDLGGGTEFVDLYLYFIK